MAFTVTTYGSDKDGLVCAYLFAPGEAALDGAGGAGAPEIIQRVLGTVCEFVRGGRPADDLTLLVVRRPPAGPQNGRLLRLVVGSPSP